TSDAKLRAEITDGRGDGFDVRQLADSQRIVVRQLFASAHLFGRTAEGKRFDVEGKNNVRADAGDNVLHVVVQSAADRRHADDHGNADHNAQHSQRRAQLVAADRVRRHANDFAELTFTHRKKDLVIG